MMNLFFLLLQIQNDKSQMLYDHIRQTFYAYAWYFFPTQQIIRCYAE